MAILNDYCKARLSNALVYAKVANKSYLWFIEGTENNTGKIYAINVFNDLPFAKSYKNRMADGNKTHHAFTCEYVLIEDLELYSGEVQP